MASLYKLEGDLEGLRDEVLDCGSGSTGPAPPLCYLANQIMSLTGYLGLRCVLMHAGMACGDQAAEFLAGSVE